MFFDCVGPPVEGERNDSAACRRVHVGLKVVRRRGRPRSRGDVSQVWRGGSMGPGGTAAPGRREAGVGVVASRCFARPRPRSSVPGRHP
jgi:hypothetical protein